MSCGNNSYFGEYAREQFVAGMKNFESEMILWFSLMRKNLCCLKTRETKLNECGDR